MESKYTRRRRKAADRPKKPKKPYKEYPLYAHPLGYWSKKCSGRIIHFGRWARVVNKRLTLLPYEESWQSALRAYKARVDDAEAGLIQETVVTTEKSADDVLTIKRLCNTFLTAKLRKLGSGDLVRRSFQELEATARRLAKMLGENRQVNSLVASDFEKLRAALAKTCGPVRLGNEITRIKSIFKYATDNLPNVGPIRYGSEFNKPDKSVLRRHKAASDKKLFTPAELRRLLEATAGNVTVERPATKTRKAKKAKLKANPSLRAMILLGINAGAGNTDVANLTFSHLDLDGGWLNYPRTKTGIGRRVPLWPETVAALKAVIKARPTPQDAEEDGKVVFLTPAGGRYVRVTEKSRKDDVTGSFGKLLRQLKINGRKGLGFYSLRHTFATIGLQTGDRDAVKSLMGHAFGDVLSLYDETGPSDERLEAVTQHVRRWLFG